MANKERSLKLLETYFKTTPEEQILKDMRRYCPELFLDTANASQEDGSSQGNANVDAILQTLERLSRFVSAQNHASVEGSFTVDIVSVGGDSDAAERLERAVIALLDICGLEVVDSAEE